MRAVPYHRILLTGFEPFREHAVNSSWEAVSRAAPRLDPEVRALLLPVEHCRAHEALRAALEAQQPHVVLCTGLAVGDALRIERRARRPTELHFVDGAESLPGAWPWAELDAAIAGAGCPVAHSEDAGGYVCESTYWSLLAFRETTGYPEYAAFLHVPPLGAAFSAEVLARAIECAVSSRALALSPSV